MTTRQISRSPNLREMLTEIINERLLDLHVALPGRVESYDASKQEADIKPLVKRLIAADDGEEILEEIPIIPNVPIIFPRGGGFFVSFPIKKGDHCLLVFNERSIDNFLAGTGGDSDPDDFRMHSLTDAVAYPGFYPDSKALADADEDNAVFGEDGGPQVHAGNDQINLYEKNAADFVALAQKVLDELNRVKGDLDAHKTVFNAHTHLYFPGPLAQAATATPPAPFAGGSSPSSVAADKVKAT